MKKINGYIDNVFCKEDVLLEEVTASIEENGMPSISVSPSTGKLLTMLVTISGASRILEIGALGGYSGICLVRGFGREGSLVSLELKEEYAALARNNLVRAGFSSQVSYRIGEALTNLGQLKTENEKFDFFFIDADKANYGNYLEYCIELAEPGALIVADNVLARGSVVDSDVPEKRYTEAMKTFNELTANHPKLESILVPVGDGLTVSRVKN